MIVAIRDEPEIRPDDAGADKAEVRRDDQAGQLLLGIVGESEDDPGGLRPGLERADLDSPDDAVGAGRGRHLDAVALGAVTLDRPRQVDCVRIDRDPYRLHRVRGAPERRQRDDEDDDAEEGSPNARPASGALPGRPAPLRRRLSHWN